MRSTDKEILEKAANMLANADCVGTLRMILAHLARAVPETPAKLRQEPDRGRLS